MAKMKVSALAERFNLDPKAVITKLTEAGMTVKRRNSSVDEDAACSVLSTDNTASTSSQGAEVVDLNDARRNKAAQSKKSTRGPKSNDNDWYAKYPWVVRGSVREPTPADRKALGSRCHGKVCTVKCVDTGVERIVNTQDAFQSKRSPEAQKAYVRRRRSEYRKTRKEKKVQTQH